ncbi:hypothetical protein CAOG_02649 [Capsaspora owczarzaki ATCC 30864]|uniref:G-protein coupled receptors family 1 profile domain-containing protein n=1 Tax=Capsaspora owczarzaki (strain ATCC 30864) TaxID=595528 RepID=A0A0D2U8X7_CAPO3|nr:hypothetical protein CAOG_02649 [Capsaspora owczarzaki ATCC 30864]KJE91521.1 hypothetical protein CAOG_002649 [Capsaspora owczarzaki ATCC 30864]|eukprot:XP_004349399.1 hypothetical protein CAOG_02649 [Capsaspora owczarzaki ATCC 30864]
MATPHQASFCCSQTLPNEQLDVFNAMCLVCSLASASASVFSLLREDKFYLSRLRAAEERRFQPTIVAWLFLSDFMACIGVIVRSILSLSRTAGASEDDPQGRPPYPELCISVDVYITFFFIVTFFWTFSFALEQWLYTAGIKHRMWWFHVISWLAALALTAIGNGIVDASSGFACESSETMLRARYLAIFIPMLFVLLANPTLFCLAYVARRRNARAEGEVTAQTRDRARQVLLQMAEISFVFIVCWMPSIVNGVMEYADVTTTGNSLFALWVIQGITNPSQGLLNMFVYSRVPSSHVGVVYNRYSTDALEEHSRLVPAQSKPRNTTPAPRR